MNTTQQKKHYRMALLAAGVIGMAIFGATGCGSGPGYSSGPITNPITSTIGRGNENNLSSDAKILATRQATGATVSLDAARAFDIDLTKIRAAHPAVADVHARSAFEPKTLLVLVKPTAPWLGKWEASANAPSTVGDTDLSTGETTLDALLKKYDATRTTSSLDFNTSRYFVLRFAAALNMGPVASEFAQSSPNLVSAEVNGYIGDGDNITYSKSGDIKTYTFSQGYGDCPAGCINHYTHTYTMVADGSISEAITGTPPPASGGG